MIVYHLTCSDDISRLHDICKDSSIVNEERTAENEKEERQVPAIVLCKGDSCHKTFF